MSFPVNLRSVSVFLPFFELCFCHDLQLSPPGPLMFCGLRELGAPHSYLGPRLPIFVFHGTPEILNTLLGWEGKVIQTAQ